MGLPFLNSNAKRPDQIVAIDLGSRVTKAVHLQRRHDKITLHNYVLIDAPSADQSLSVDLISDHLKDVAKALDAPRTRPVTLTIGVNDSLFRHVELPLMPVDDMRQMLKFNSKSYLQQDLTD